MKLGRSKCTHGRLEAQYPPKVAKLWQGLANNHPKAQGKHLSEATLPRGQGPVIVPVGFRFRVQGLGFRVCEAGSGEESCCKKGLGLVKSHRMWMLMLTSGPSWYHEWARTFGGHAEVKG